MAKDDLRWDLKRTNLSALRKLHYELAVLPVGAVEAHNHHLPEGMDVIHTEYVAQTCCRRAWEQCGSVICLPAVPFGVDANLMAFPLTVHVSQTTLDAYVNEIVQSLHHHGLRKFVIINGHGGNDFKPLIRQLQYEMDVFVFSCDWWKVGSDVFEGLFGLNDDHAGAMETSVALTLCPELVDLDKAGPGDVPPYRFEALNRGWLTSSRDFSKLNDHCAVSSTAKPSAEKGRRYLTLICDRITNFLIELAKADIDDRFPFSQEGMEIKDGSGKDESTGDKHVQSS